MKILHLCPLWFPVSRNSKGGIETFLPGLLNALRDIGCQNTIIASGDSRTSAELLPAVPVNIWDEMEAGNIWEYDGYIEHEILMAIQLAPEFDVIQSHVGWPAYVLSSLPGVREKVLHTQHNPVTHDLEWFVGRHPDMRMTTVSEFQARKLQGQGARHCTVVPNGIDVDSFTLQTSPKGGLLFLGRLEEDKGPDIAIEVAKELALPLKLAGPAVDHEYFEKHIKAQLDDQIQYVGVVDHQEKNHLYGDAQCVLMTSRWEEPFGLVAVEAMACGTPVVAMAHGGLPEIVDQSLTGFLASTAAELAALVPLAKGLDRTRVRSRAIERFDLRVVAAGYMQAYRACAEAGAET
jgi:glycosyltransferase involved in cell wall biosynthesis